jgi:hypothetical protein
MITATEADGDRGRLRVERTWAAIRLESDLAAGTISGWQLTLQSATLNGEDVIWPRSAEIAGEYMAQSPDFRAWMERTEP